MDSDNFYSRKVYNVFENEFLYCEHTTWTEFLRSKDLGIMFLGFAEYRIIDKKKWLLTKIKYGI